MILIKHDLILLICCIMSLFIVIKFCYKTVIITLQSQPKLASYMHHTVSTLGAYWRLIQDYWQYYHDIFSAHKLAIYYNELVIQLRLAQYNLNDSIALEVKEEKLSYAFRREEQIIKLLNESILPALETTVSNH